MLVLSAPFPVIDPQGRAVCWFVSSQAVKFGHGRLPVAFFVGASGELVLHDGHLDCRGERRRVLQLAAESWCPVHSPAPSKVPTRSVLGGTWIDAWTLHVDCSAITPTPVSSHEWQGDDLQIYFHTHFSPHASCSCAMLERQLTTVCSQECLFCCEHFTIGSKPFQCEHIVHANCSKFMQACPFCRSPRGTRPCGPSDSGCAA